MKSTLPLPKSTMKELQNVVSSDIGQRNLIQNALTDLCNYEYDDALTIIKILNKEYPNVINYKNAVRNIKSAKQRYLSL